MPGPSSQLPTQVRAAFLERFGTDPSLVVRAPGRVNLIGEHTDYNQGFVFPAAIDREMVIAARPRADRRVGLYSLDYSQEDGFDLEAFERLATGPLWSNYVRGVIRVLLDGGFALAGFDAVLAGNVPQGAGLSSSAALEVATAMLVSEMFDLALPGRDLALLSQQAENRFVGVQCGIMDQFVSALGQEDCALLIDCRSLEYRPVKLELQARGALIAIVDSGVRRGLIDSQFNTRRQECREAVQALEALLKRPLESLREVTPSQFDSVADRLPEGLRSRARHVISENDRVLRGVAALERGDLKGFGQLMNQSHRSLQADYDVSIPELDMLVSLAQDLPGVFGARMTGAGFGGCTVSLLEATALPDFRSKVLAGYAERTGREARLWVCRAAQGAGRA